MRIFFDNGLIFDSKCSMSLPSQFIRNLLKFQLTLQFLNPFKFLLVSHLYSSCWYYPLTLIFSVISNVILYVLSQKLFIFFSLNGSWKKNWLHGVAIISMLENCSCNFCKSLYCDVYPQYEATLTIKIYLFLLMITIF